MQLTLILWWFRVDPVLNAPELYTRAFSLGIISMSSTARPNLVITWYAHNCHDRAFLQADWCVEILNAGLSIQSDHQTHFPPFRGVCGHKTSVCVIMVGGTYFNHKCQPSQNDWGRPQFCALYPEVEVKLQQNPV